MPEPSTKRRLPAMLIAWVIGASHFIVQAVRWLLRWIGQHELGVLLSLAVAALAIWGFVELADEVLEGSTTPFDEWAVRVMRRSDDPSQPIGPRWLAEIGRDITALGGIAVLLLLIAAVSGFLWLKRMYAAMLLVTGASLSGLLLSLALKEAFARPRPNLVPHLSYVYTSSFPSGHSMLSATVFLTLGALLGQFADSFVLRAYFLLVAIVLTVLVGASRVYLGVHYPSDVLAGWSAGLAWALICALLARLLHRRGVVSGKLAK